MPDANGNPATATAMQPAPAQPATLRAPFLVVDDFLPLELAQAMRKDIEDHFGDPYRQAAKIHQVWNYWYVPRMYTYMRTTPEKVIAPPRMERMMDALRAFASGTLGMTQAAHPLLSLYVAGCSQNLHNDAKNGRFGYVYSLTPNERKTSGGETLIFKEGDPFRNNLDRAAAGTAFYELVPPRFNRLVIFDDRVPHAVERVEGSMDPREGRIVLHGHLADGGPILTGALAHPAVFGPVGDALRPLLAELDSARAGVLRGLLVVRLLITSSGRVARTEVLVDRVKQMDARFPEPDAFVAKVISTLCSPQFPSSAGETSVTLPILFGGAQPPGQ